MAEIVRTVRSGVRDVDGLLGEHAWAGHSLTYSFPTRAYQWSGYGYGDEPYDYFEPLNATQRSVVTDVLGQYSAVANLRFTATTAGFGTLRFGMSDVPETAHAYLPTTSAVGGDSWYNNSGPRYDNPLRGNYAYHTFLHESGDALGLKHAHE